MNPEEFRRIALNLPETEEVQQLGRMEYRTGGRVFAAVPDSGESIGMVWLEPREAARLAEKHGGITARQCPSPEERAALMIDLSQTDRGTIAMIVAAAWGLAACRLV